MAAGCCCVAFDFVAGPRDMISNEENGVVVPFGDMQKLALTIDALILNETKRKKMGNKAIEIRKKLEMSNIILQIKKFIT